MQKGDNEAAVDEQVQLNAVVSAIMEWIGPLTTNRFMACLRGEPMLPKIKRGMVVKT